MKKIALIVVAVVMAGLVGLWLYFFPTYSWHQKMTVEVEVKGKIYSGSSVVAMSVTVAPDFMPVHGDFDIEMQGEAVVLELPGNQYLFALLTFNPWLASQVFEEHLTEPRVWESRQELQIISRLREARDITLTDYPLLVTFENIDDPTTINKVNPGNLAVMFGSGVKLKRITLEITDETVTEGKIESVLPCLRSGKACVPLNRELPYGDPMSNILNSEFWRPK